MGNAKNTEEELLRKIVSLEKKVADLEMSRSGKTILYQPGENGVPDSQSNGFGSAFKNMQNGYAYHKVVTDPTGKAVDYIFLEINKSFERLTGLKEKAIIGRFVTDVLPGIERAPSKFIEKYGEVALSGTDARFEIYSEPLESWYSVYAYSPQKGYFITLFENITEKKKTEETLKNIVTKFSAFTGVEFFNQACFHLYNLLQTDLIIIGKFSSAEHQVQVLSSTRKGELMDPFDYSTIDTPCYNALKSDDFVHYTNLFESIPQGHILLEMGMTEYAGIPLFNRFGNPIGIIALLHSKPIKSLKLSKTLLRSFSQKVVAEMERMSWEEQLSASEDLNRSITENAGDAIISFNSDGIILSWNNAASKIFAYLPEEMLGSDIIKIIPESIKEDYLSKIRNLKDKSFTNLLGQRIELTTKSKKGDELNVEVILSHWTKDNQYFFTSIIRDTTERNVVAKALSESQEKYRTVFNNTPIGISTTNLSGVFVDVNPAFCNILGYSREEVINRHYNDFTHPEDITKNNIEIESLIREEVTTTNFEKRYIHKDDRTIFVNVKGQLVFDNKRNSILQIAIIEDVTERNRTERIQRVLYNISNEVIRTNSLSELLQKIKLELGTILDTTNFYVALFDEESNKISLPIFVDEKDSYKTFPTGKTLTSYVFKTQKPLYGTKNVLSDLEEQGEIEKIGTDTEIWLGVPLIVEDKAIGVLAVQSYTRGKAYEKSDIKILEFVADQIGLSIRRIRAEESLLKALGKAKESDRLKSAFLATMSHELRTPLNAIIGFSEFLDKDLPHEDVEKFGEIIYTSGNHLLSIVNDLFEITLIEAGEIRIRNEIVSIKQLLTEIFAIIVDERQRIYKEEVEINMVLPTQREDVIILTDPNKLKQVILNLLKNAVKFTKKGYVNYGFEYETINGNKMLKFFVKDTGIGIAKEKQEYIFEIFRQVQDSKSRKYNGTGIGLSVAKKLVEILGGSIGVESEENKGSLFYFYLPLVESDFEQQILRD